MILEHFLTTYTKINSGVGSDSSPSAGFDVRTSSLRARVSGMRRGLRVSVTSEKEAASLHVRRSNCVEQNKFIRQALNHSSQF